MRVPSFLVRIANPELGTRNPEPFARCISIGAEFFLITEKDSDAL